MWVENRSASRVYVLLHIENEETGRGAVVLWYGIRHTIGLQHLFWK